MRFKRGQSAIPGEISHQKDELLFSKGVSNLRGYHPTTQQGALNFFSSTVIVGTTPRVIIGASSVRAFLFIQNQSANDVFLGFGVQPVATGKNAVKLIADAAFSFTDGIVPNNEILAVASAANSLVSIVEAVPA